MSQENVELACRAHDAFNRRDLDAFLGFMDPEVELTTRFMELEGDPYYRGHDGVREWWRTLLGVFPDFSTEVLEVRELVDSLVMAVRVRGHGLEGGAPFDEVLWQAINMRDGKATWWRNFTSEADALEAAGLSEKAISRQNVEIVRQGFDAMNAFIRGDLTMEALAEHLRERPLRRPPALIWQPLPPIRSNAGGGTGSQI